MKFKRILSLLLSISICAGCLMGISFTAFAADGENVALGKPTRASSQWDNLGAPERVVNGVKNDYWARGSIQLEGTAATGGREWVMVDLEQKYEIDSVSLYLRSGDGGSAKNVRVDFSNDPDFKTYESITAFDDQGTGVKLGEENNYKVNFKTPYRYVRAVCTASMFFVLAEIEVYGEMDTGVTTLETYRDVKGTEYEAAVNLIQNLGLMDPETETQFGTYHFVTRAQVVDAIVKAFAEVQTPVYGEELPFTDVSTGHPLYNSIFTAHKIGYVRGNGDGTFSPEGYVTGLELATMLLRAMGYGARLEVDSAPSVAAQRIARRLGIYIDPVENEGKITRGDFAQTLYNAMLAPMYDVKSIDEDGISYTDGESVLAQKFGLTLYTDVVFENRITTLLKESKERDNIAVVGDMEFTDPNGALDGFIGRSVVIGVYDSAPNEIAFAWPADDNSEVTIKADELVRNLSEIESGKISQIVGDSKTKTYSISPTAKYIYNGVAYPDATAEDVLIENGYITLVDSNDDSAYDVIDINSYVMYFVEGFTYASETVYLKGKTERENESTGVMEEVYDEYTIKGENVIYYNDEGEKKNASTIKKGSIIALYASPYNNNYTIRAFSKAVSGEFTEYDGDYIYVDGAAYERGPGFSVPVAVKLGDVIDVYVDEDGRVIYVTKSTDTEVKAWSLGFCANWTNGGGFADELKFKVFTESGEFKIFYPADTVTLDGARTDIERLNEIMVDGTDVLASTGERYLFHNFWRYKLNGEGEISQIDSLNYNAEKETEDTFKPGGTLQEWARYTSAGSAFYYQNQFIIPARNTAVAFTIPTVGGEYTTNENYDKYYSVGKLTSIITDREGYVSANEPIHYYMQDEYGFPAYFSKSKNFSASSMDVCSSDSGYMLVTDIGQSIDAEGMDCVQVTGMALSSGKEISFSLDKSANIIELGRAYQDKQSWFGYGNGLNMSSIVATAGYESYFTSVKNLVKGDVLRYQDKNGTYVAERAFHYDKAALPDMKRPSWFDSTGGYINYQFATNRFQFGKVADLNIGILDLEVTYTSDGATTVAHEKYVADDVKGIAVYVVHDRGVDKETGDKLYAYKGDQYRVLFYTTQGAPSKAVVYTYS